MQVPFPELSSAGKSAKPAAAGPEQAPASPQTVNDPAVQPLRRLGLRFILWGGFLFVGGVALIGLGIVFFLGSAVFAGLSGQNTSETSQLVSVITAVVLIICGLGLFGIFTSFSLLIVGFIWSKAR